MKVQILKEKLLSLKNTDKNFNIFGAVKHRYKNFPVTSQEISSFERKFNFILPEDFRLFLTEIGYGAGPYYGIWDLKEISLELETEIEDFRKEENVFVSVSNEFPFGQKDIELIQENFSTKDFSQTYLQGTYPANGSISILSQGCQGFGSLIVSGEYAGTIWDLYYEAGYTGFWRPARPVICLQASNKHKKLDKYELKRFPTIAPENYAPKLIKFLDWYDNWLDNSLSAFAELKQHNSFRFFNKLKPL